MSLKLCLIGMIIRRIENKGEKNRVKFFFFCSCLVDMRVESGRDFGGTHKFSFQPHQNRIIPNRERKWAKQVWTKLLIFDFYFFGY